MYTLTVPGGQLTFDDPSEVRFGTRDMAIQTAMKIAAAVAERGERVEVFVNDDSELGPNRTVGYAWVERRLLSNGLDYSAKWAWVRAVKQPSGGYYLGAY